MNFLNIGNQNQNQNQGGSIIPGMLGMGLGLGTTLWQNWSQNERENRAYQNQRNLMHLQQQNQMALNSQGYRMQKRLWEETNYPAQMKMLEKAGLNPALLYGMSGGGGTTTGTQTGGAAASGTAPQPQQLDIRAIMDGIKAIVEVSKNQAQTEQIKEETKTEAGINERGQAAIKLFNQELKNKEAERQGQLLENQFQRIENKVANATSEDRIDRVTWEVEELIKRTTKLGYENEIQEAIIQDRINFYKAQTIGQILENVFTESKIYKTDAEIEAIYTSLSQKWKELNLRGLEGKTELSRIGVEMIKTEVMQQLGHTAQDTQLISAYVNAISTILGAGIIGGTFAGGGRTTVKGYK